MQAAARPEILDADGRDAVETLEREADRMARIVEMFLDLSRIEAGRLQVDPEPVDIAGLLLEQSEAVQRRYPHVAVTVTGAEAPLVIVTDPVRAEQALSNLLDNAVKYGGDPPTVTLTLDHESGSAVIRVRDSGPGIAAEDQPHIFERRYRGNTTKGKRGLGVGLFITREIVDALGGTLTLTSRPGEGAEFVLTLPASSTRQA
jgi:signal transduction histidine kinase